MWGSDKFRVETMTSVEIENQEKALIEVYLNDLNNGLLTLSLIHILWPKLLSIVTTVDHGFTARQIIIISTMRRSF